MTSELEKQFFQCFGIEPRLKTFAIKQNKQGELTYPPIYEYPQITDSIGLELFVIITRYIDIMEGFASLQELKKFVLEELMYSLTQPECDIVKQQVCTLFEVE